MKMAEIKYMSCDIETYSDVNLNKCGVYKYAQSPAFEILLLGVAINGGAVQVYDLAQGETVPMEIIRALTDESVLKWAFNASFERVCLSVWLRRFYPEHFTSYGIHEDTVGDYLAPTSWRCSMVWSAYIGLPLSLAGVGAVLGLEEQKLKEGKDLIRYFCVPCKETKSNGGRTRNLPEHDMEKWELFKSYNKRDVEVEMSIQERLKKYPVPDFVWEEYHLDQEINDRGIALDMTLVRNAIAFDEKSKAVLSEKMQELTNLDNPNSVQQMKQWLSDNGLEMDSLGKKEVAAVLKTAPEPLRTVLSLRQQLAKSSVKKYQAMENAVCADGRARGMFMFYGANRTGRFCLTGDHEVLTDTGWRRLDEWNGGRIACWNAVSEAVSFQDAEQVCFPYEGKMYTYQDVRIDQCSTPDHKMRVQHRFGGDWEDMTVAEMAKCRPVIPFTGYRHRRDCADPYWLRVLIMTQADGFYTADGSVRYNFKKKRKIERCKRLLRRAEIPFLVYEQKGGVTNINVPARAVPLWLREFRSKTFGMWMLDENAEIIFDELPNWDGYFPAPNSIQYTTSNKQNADIIQALAHMSGRCCSMKIKRHTDKPKWSDAYVLNIWLTPGNRHEIKAKPIIEDFQGNVYCAVTKTGYFLVRRNGKVWVTGNSGRIIQLQNLPQNHMLDLEQARGLVRSGNYNAMALLYDDIPDTLSQLIRTAFVPRPGMKFIVSDFSAIEARVIAWLANEKWVLDTFERGEDLYCATASRMFHVPVVKHGINGHLRQKGKQATLSCSYGGSVGALKAMGALEAGMKEDELQPLVNAWREANPMITKLWWEVDRCVKECVKKKVSTETHGIRFFCQSGMLFIRLPSGRQLSYVKPRMGENRFGGESVTYEGVGGTKKWERIESYGPKFVENIVQAISRDILMYAMRTLSHCFICGHVHDELIIECSKEVSLNAICEQMGRTPPWMPGLLLRADGYECEFYKKD